jgi:Domain of unknown function (DUF5666)
MRRVTLRNHSRAFGAAPWLPVLLALSVAHLSAGQQPAPPSRVLGTIQAVKDKTLTVLSDSGTASTVFIEDATRLLQIEPGKTDLKEAAPLALADLQPGDRVLVRGALSEDGKTLRASSLVAMKKAAISEKQSKERAEWQRGVGGLVKSIDPAAQTVVLTTNGFSANKEVVLHLGKDAGLRRYAPDSTRFDAAKIAPLSALQVGDQLRARGSRGPDGASFEAVEVVSGTFRNVAGTVTSIDASGHTVVIHDLASKSDVTLRVSGESQMRKLPAPMAERLAARLKGQSGEASAEPAPGQQNGVAATPQRQASQQADQGAGPTGGNRGGGDFQQMLARMPAASLADLQTGDAVMVVTTEGSEKDSATVITLLAGVEPILRASPKGAQDMILSPWTLGGGEPSAN